jgi:hypothetical protein
MDSSRIHEDITNTLYKVEEQYARIIQFNNNIPTLEIDLALKDIQELYECFLDLKSAAAHLRRNNLSALASKVALPKVEEKVEVEVAPVSTPEITAEQNEVIKQLEKPIVIAEEKIEVKTETPTSPIAWQMTINGEEIKEESKAKVAPANVYVAPNTPPAVAPKIDLLKEREKDFVPTVRKIEFKQEPVQQDAKKESIFDKAASLYDKIAKPVTEKSTTNTANRQPISNIKSAIGINEKFTYLKDLFKNNVNDYNESLEKLNNFENYSDAEDCFQEMKSKYGWDPESKSFQGLAELLNRRYLYNS